MPQAAPADTPCAATSPERSLGLQLRRIVTLLVAAIDRRMEPLGLTDAQWKPLLRLLSADGATATALARECHIDSGGLTRLLDRLQAKGLVRRERAPHDRRVVQVALTDEGRAVANQLPELLAQVQAQMLRGFDEAEQQALRGLLGRLQANAEALAGPADD